MIGRFKCQMCKHFLTPDKHVQEWKCDAFPKGIPETKICHITRDSCIDCNNGIGFEQEEHQTGNKVKTA